MYSSVRAYIHYIHPATMIETFMIIYQDQLQYLSTRTLLKKLTQGIQFMNFPSTFITPFFSTIWIISNSIQIFCYISYQENIFLSPHYAPAINPYLFTFYHNVFNLISNLLNPISLIPKFYGRVKVQEQSRLFSEKKHEENQASLTSC